MRVAVAFQNDRIELDVPEGRLVDQWQGPPDDASTAPFERVLHALEHPRDYPALRQAVVPGDRVAIALDPQTPEASAALAAACQVFRSAGVEGDAITVVAPSGFTATLPDGVTLAIHDAADREELAYLSTTTEGQRVYLNRQLTDADFVLPVGRLGYDPVIGYRGPWSTIFPDLADAETQRSLRSKAGGSRPRPERPGPALRVSAEVSWLLGSQFQLGLVGGVNGMALAIGGLESAVRTEGMQALNGLWSFEASSRAELVVAGVGGPGRATTIDELAEGLETAVRLVQRGGKIVVLSRAEGTLGPALQRLIGADSRHGAAALRGHEAEPDYVAARQFARALDWADVYLLSALPPNDVEELSIIALGRPEEARRLVAAAGSCIVLSQAERTRADVADEDEEGGE